MCHEASNRPWQSRHPREAMVPAQHFPRLLGQDMPLRDCGGRVTALQYLVACRNREVRNGGQRSTCKCSCMGQLASTKPGTWPGMGVLKYFLIRYHPTSEHGMPQAPRTWDRKSTPANTKELGKGFDQCQSVLPWDFFFFFFWNKRQLTPTRKKEEEDEEGRKKEGEENIPMTSEVGLRRQILFAFRGVI